VQQDSVAWLQPLLGDKEPFRAIPRRDQVLGRQSTGTRYDWNIAVIDATTSFR
jgi:hypothetical protein